MLNDLIALTEEAGKIAMKYYKSGVDVEYKNGDKFDPLTKADIEIDAFLRKGVKKLLDAPILSEEHDKKDINYKGDVWMIDPIDGTKDFVGGSGKFSVMVGLCHNGKPQIGVVYLPAIETWYYAEKGSGSFRFKKGDPVPTVLNVSEVDKLKEARCIGKSQFSENRDIEDDIRQVLGVSHLLVGGTVGQILGQIAEGSADLYFFTNPRGGKRDVCAPQIILEEAGGRVTDYKGRHINYEKPGYKIENGFIASNRILHKEAIKGFKDVRD